MLVHHPAIWRDDYKSKTETLYYTFPFLDDSYIPLPDSTKSDLRNPDKDVLRQTILDLRTQGMSYRQITELVGLHWTRVGQIARMEGDHSATG